MSKLTQLKEILFDETSSLYLNDSVIVNLFSDVLSLVIFTIIIGLSYTSIRQFLKKRALKLIAKRWNSSHIQFISDAEYLLLNSLNKKDDIQYLNDFEYLKLHTTAFEKETPKLIIKYLPEILVNYLEYDLIRRSLITVMEAQKKQIGVDEWKANLNKVIEKIKDSKFDFNDLHLSYIEGISQLDLDIDFTQYQNRIIALNQYFSK